jgi:hypothetical protein
MMKRLASGILSLSAGLLVGCERTDRPHLPSMDAATPSTTETATFALG